jgi:glycolate oxidase iron-sulfur subunit
METTLAPHLAGTLAGQAAESILRKCVHCGFCTATCPTYQLLGDELDSPRGRIYLIKQMVEGAATTATTRTHLDRCLTCRSCETTCPSGVEYGRLVDIGRELAEAAAPRPPVERLWRWLLRQVITREQVFTTLLGVGRLCAPLLPKALRASLHRAPREGNWPARIRTRQMVVLRGCVQPALAPRINAAAARVLDTFGITLRELDSVTCCGAVEQHMSAPDAALQRARANVDAWSNALDNGAEAIVMTASGCGAMVREYGHLLANDTRYAQRAARVGAHTRDLAEVVQSLPLEDIAWRGLSEQQLAYHPPCTLQHGQKLPGIVEGLLARLGVNLKPVRDAHLCCGSAGAYSILQPELSGALRERKLEALSQGQPERILTANIGCLHHLQSGCDVPVEHWIEALDRALPST